MSTIVSAAFLAQRKRAVDAADDPEASKPQATGVLLSPEQRSAISVEAVQKRDIQSDVTAPGRLAFNGNRISPVFSQFSGRLVRLDVEVGAAVRAGQTLGLIDTPDIVAMQSDYQQAVTAERTARTAFDLARRTRERAARLAEVEAIPRRELQQAQADEARAADDLARAQAAVAAARGRLQSAGVSDEEIGRLVAGAPAINHLVRLVAPISGTITERKAGLGQVVQPGAADPLFMIADLSTVWVNADVYEEQLASVRVGAPVKIQTPAYPTETFSARVDQIGSVVDPDKHTIAVRCVVSNRGHLLKPGMFATVILRGEAWQRALVVPASAVIAEGNQRAIFVEEAPNRFVKRVVETGEERAGTVIIRSGLSEGERVVVRGSLLIAAQR
jgi:cobalt-zinc-cadmium efflux system membrane fusion protein